ncbi:hypothetical protein GC174_05150 [bacterium]|nr:hypothetical protein [bacterium]
MNSDRHPLKYLFCLTATSLSLIALSALSSGCGRGEFKDEKRDAMVSTYDKVKKVLGRELHVSKDRLVINQSLAQLGVNEENRLKIQDSLEKELDIKIPYATFNPNETVGTIVRVAADLKTKALAKKKEEEESASEKK